MPVCKLGAIARQRYRKTDVFVTRIVSPRRIQQAAVGLVAIVGVDAAILSDESETPQASRDGRRMRPAGVA